MREAQQGRGFHPADALLIAYHDGEISWRDRGRVRRHLGGCAACREREGRIVRVLGEVAAVGGGGVPDGRPARAMLRARMLGEVVSVAGWWLGWRNGVAVMLLLAVALFSFAVYEGADVGRGAGSERRAGSGLAAAAGPGNRAAEPDGRLTPGATREVLLTEICPRGDDEDQDPAVEPTTEQTVFREYGMEGASRGKFQVDYLISPQLGGTGELRNLWPQPYEATVWNARAKDALETRLHEMVCGREMDLRAAQELIATDWISAYRRVFHTEWPG